MAYPPTVTLWFAVVFFLLPDGRPRWKILLTGALVTSILFNISKLILRWLLTYSNINSIYGASASMVLLLLFVFYVALIFYYGASFANVWANANDKPNGAAALRHQVPAHRCGAGRRLILQSCFFSFPLHVCDRHAVCPGCAMRCGCTR